MGESERCLPCFVLFASFVVRLSGQTILHAPNDQVHHEGREEHEGKSRELAPVQILFHAMVLWNSRQAGGLPAISRWSSAANTAGRPFILSGYEIKDVAQALPASQNPSPLEVIFTSPAPAPPDQVLVHSSFKRYAIANRKVRSSFQGKQERSHPLKRVARQRMSPFRHVLCGVFPTGR